MKSRVVADYGINPGHMKALMSLEPGEAVPMGACAQDMGVDASTATWLIDRLEEKGLVERHPSPTDRRVKGVVLTERGEAIRKQLHAHYGEPPAALLDLSPEELDALYSLLAKLSEAARRLEAQPAQV